MTPDLIRRHNATRATMNKFRKKAFSWEDGVNCATLAWFHAGKMGRRRTKLPPHKSPLGAVRVLKQLGCADTIELIDKHIKGAKRIAPAMMLQGDIGVVKAMALDGVQDEHRQPLKAIVICAGPQKLFGWREDKVELVVLDIDMSQIDVAWRL